VPDKGAGSNQPLLIGLRKHHRRMVVAVRGHDQNLSDRCCPAG
jgi:hypothetical protein